MADNSDQQKAVAKSNFTRINKNLVNCDHCKKNITSNSIDRWCSHLRKCESAPEQVKSALRKRGYNTLVIEKSSQPSSSTNSSIRPEDSISEEKSSSAPTELHCSSSTSNIRGLKKWVDTMDTATSLRLDKAFAKIFYQTAIPFRIADSKSVKDFMQLARPVYKPPSSKRISGSLLQNAVLDMEEVVNQYLLESAHFLLVTDGWSNLRNEHLVNYMCVTPGSKPPVFLTSESTKQVQQTGQNIADSIINQIVKLGPHKITSVVTDNAANMRAAWKIIESTYPQIHCNGCAAHVFNLLVKDVCQLEGVSAILEDSSTITHFIRGRTDVLDRFRAIQDEMLEHDEIQNKRGLVYSNNTRWYTHHRCLQRVLENQSVIVQLSATPVITRMNRNPALKKKNDFLAIVNSHDFWSNLAIAESKLQPTSEVIATLESNNANLSEVYRSFVNLMNKWQGQEELQKLALERWNFIHTESMGYAYFLDPKTMAGQNMYSNDKEDTIDQLKQFMSKNGIGVQDQITRNHYKQLVENEINDFIDYVTDAVGAARRNISSSTPRAWWKTSGREKFPYLYHLAIQVFSIPTSSAASERVWSTFDFIHSKRRNRLSAEKTSNLVFLYANSAIEAFENKEIDYAKLIMNLGEFEDSSEEDEN